MKKHILLASILIGSTLLNNMSAQNRRYTEAEINLQSSFMEANQARMLGKTEEAEKIYLEILKKDAQNHAVMYELSRLYFVENKDVEALKNIKTATELDKTNVWYRQLLADVCEKNGKGKEAAAIYEKLAAENPNKEDYFLRLAELYSNNNELLKAIKAYDVLEKRIGVEEEIIRRKHDLYIDLNDLPKAEKELQKLINAYPNEIDYYKILAGFYQQIGKTEQLKSVYQKILTLAPNDAAATMALASASKAGSSDIDFLQSLKNIFEKPNVNIDAKIKQVLPYLQKAANTNDKTLAMAGLELAQILEKVHPSEAKAYAMYGDFLYYSGNAKESLAKYEKALTLDKNVYAVWEQVLNIAYETKNFDILLKQSEVALDRFPNQSMPFYYNGIALGERKKPQEAIDSYQQALLMANNNPKLKIEIMHRIGGEYYSLKKYAQAKEWLEKALKNGGENNPNLLEHYGDTLFQLNGSTEAVVFWQKAKEKGSKSEYIDKKITDKKLYE